MSKEKQVTRTIITGYDYDVLKREGNNLNKVDAITIDKPIRSIKQQNEVLADNGFDGSHVLVLNKAVSKQFTMNESDFILHATQVTDVSENETEQENIEE